MPNGLMTPELVMEVAEAVEDYQITAEEFSDIMGSITGVSAGIVMAGFIGMLMGAIAKGFTKETGIKTKEVAGIPIPLYQE